jgi:hypothetical protein
MTTESASTRTAARTQRRRIDILALSGAAATLLAFVASAPDGPADVSAAGLREHLATAGGAWQTYAILMACAGAVLVVFFAHLRTVLVAGARSTGKATTLPDTAFGAGLIAATWLIVSAGCTAAVVVGDPTMHNDITLLSYWSLGDAADMIGVAAFTVKGLAMIAVGVAVVRTRVLGSWVGWLSIALGAVTWTALFVPTMLYAGIFAFPLWPLTISIALLARGLRRRAIPELAV